jgi:Domain of Unknown Function (DUF928)
MRFTIGKKPQFNLAAKGMGVSLAALALATSFTVRAQATSGAKAVTSGNGIGWEVSQFVPPDRGAPTTVGGASRGGSLCEEIAPLIPKDSEHQDKPYFGLAVTDRPTFFSYFRGSPDYVGKEVIFYLDEYNPQTDRASELYEAKLTLPDRAGTISVSLPESVKLEVGKVYKWSMQTICESSDTTTSTSIIDEYQGVSGWIELVDRSDALSRKLAMAKSASSRAKVYAEAGIWFDALDTLARERMTADSPALQASWQQLLQSIDIVVDDPEAAWNAPMIDCCSETEASALTPDR